MKILVAEDEGAIAEQYLIVFQSKGHEVKITKNGLECTDVYNDAMARLQPRSDEQLACSPPFDVVVLDYRMPKMDGLQAAKLILDANKHQRIIFASAYVMSSLQESVKYLHSVVEFLQKPFELDHIVHMIEDKHTKYDTDKTIKSGQLPEFTQALSAGTDATKPEMLVIAGLSLAKKGKLIEALECLLHAIELNPNNAKAWFNIAVCLGMLGNENHRSLMIHCYEESIELNPRDVEAWNNKGAILEQMGEWKHALECYKRALDINARHGNARRNLYALLVQNGNRAEAEQYYPTLDR